MKYLLIYGFAEGPWMGRSFREAMQHAGHKQVAQPEQADVIICHSAGAYAKLPPDVKAGVLLIGPPYWPGKSLFARLVRKVGLDAKTSLKQHHSWYLFRKTCWNAIYILLHPVQNWQLSRSAGQNNFFEHFSDLQVTVIRNDDDAWSTPETSEVLQKQPHTTFVTLPGQHDDCWLNPKPYVDLLQSIKR